MRIETAPHSRACGVTKHDHGPECNWNCPTCHGEPICMTCGFQVIDGQVIVITDGCPEHDVKPNLPMCRCLSGLVEPTCMIHGVQPERAGREGDTQPLPLPSDAPIAHQLVQQDLEERLALGIRRYGQPLQPFNGRDSLRDAYEEALDLCVYLRAALYEQENPR